MANNSAENRSQSQTLPSVIERADRILKKGYLASLSKCEVLPYPAKSGAQVKLENELKDSVRFFEVTQIVLNKKENMRDKLVTVFNALGNTGASFLLQIQGRKDSVSIRIGVKNPDNDINRTRISKNVLKNSLESNFPGTKISDQLSAEDLKNKVLSDFSATKAVAAVTDIAGLRSEEESGERLFTQGIEKLIDAMRGKTYTLFLIADPVSLADLNANRRALEKIYSNLVPLASFQYTVGETESEGISDTISVGVSDSISKSVAQSVSHTVGKSFTTTNGTSTTETEGTSHTTTDGTSSGTNINPGSAMGLIGGVIGFALGGVGGAAIGGAVGHGIGGTVSFSKGKNNSESEGETHSISTTKNYSTSSSSSESDTTGTTTSKAKTHTDSLQIGTGTNYQKGASTGLQISFENHTSKKLMERIDKILERYDSCADLGMWNCAMYCIGDEETAEMAASIYRSIIRGKNSSLETSCVTVWDTNKTPAVMEALKHMEHPRVVFDGLQITPGTLVSSAELAIQAGLPNHSVPGLPVLECAEFGRTVSSYDAEESAECKNYAVPLGSIWHMNHREDLPVILDANSLASHTFITGSTGAGKSNTIYKMLSEIKRFAKFLVVEPAKGEYKNVFGGREDVAVYGTNPALTPLLRINPFSFPHGNADANKNIHILEHLDRLIEIFNVCWPMYAAMPAVLKEAVEKSYEDCGWNLAESTNEYGSGLYPTFADVTRNIRTIIDSSEYDAENKGAYKGSLITRLKSLTNGINGLIFTADEISAEDLFDENVIVDLSRVGSTETKSLIMGLLVLKLQEHRMTTRTTCGEMNAPLRHVTVLEEAHNLLKRTGTEQLQESGNLLGKSVEMLTNSIAEMRTYGEGFIIADQAPALLDMAVIRNTNTKIIMRLPDKDDRELVGKAANLNDDQITELAKLPRGVSAVYQNEWVEAVLCKVAKFDAEEKAYSYKRKNAPAPEPHTNDRLEIARLLCNGVAVTGERELKDLQAKLQRLSLKASTQVMILKSVKSPLESPRYTKLAPVVSELFPAVRSAFVTSFARTSDTEQWTADVDEAIRAQIPLDIDEELRRSIRQCIITDYLNNELGKVELLERWSNGGGLR